MHKKILLVIALLYPIALAIASLLNSSNLPSIEVENMDKVVHAIAYSILGLVWYLALKVLSFSRPLLIGASGAIIYGIILEVLQETLTEVRILDIYDIVANCLGVAFISVIIMFRNKTHVKNL